MTKALTQAERIAVIETLLPRILRQQDEILNQISAIRQQMWQDKAELKSANDADVAELQMLKNKGIGIITTSSIVVGMFGVMVADKIKQIISGLLT